MSTVVEEVDTFDPTTPQDHAEQYLIGSGSHISAKGYESLIQHVREHTQCDAEEAQRAACTAMIRLGVYPNSFIWPWRPEFDIELGDHVWGGRVVYDEWAEVSGKVTRIEHQFIYVLDDDYGTHEILNYSSIWKHEPVNR